MTSLLRQFRWMNKVPFVGVDGLLHRSCETSGRSQPGSRRNVSHRRQLQISGLDADDLQGVANDRMFHFVYSTYALQLGVLNNKIGNKGFMQGDVHVFINGSRDNEAIMLAIVRRQIRATAS